MLNREMHDWEDAVRMVNDLAAEVVRLKDIERAYEQLKRHHSRMEAELMDLRAKTK